MSIYQSYWSYKSLWQKCRSFERDCLPTKVIDFRRFHVKNHTICSFIPRLKKIPHIASSNPQRWHGPEGSFCKKKYFIFCPVHISCQQLAPRYPCKFVDQFTSRRIENSCFPTTSHLNPSAIISSKKYYVKYKTGSIYCLAFILYSKPNNAPSPLLPGDNILKKRHSFWHLML